MKTRKGERDFMTKFGPKHTRLGISSYTFPFLSGVNPEQKPAQVLTPWQLIDKAEALKVDCVQFSDNLPLETFSCAQWEEIRDYAADKKIVLENGMRCMTPDRLQLYIHISAQMQVKLLRVITDGGDYTPDMAEIVKTVRSCLPLLEENSIVLGIENHDRFLAQEYAEMMEQIHHPLVGLVVDSTNSLSQEESIDEVLHYMAPYCVCFHVKDYTICRSNSGVGLSITGKPAGEGRQKIPHILHVLRQQAKCDFSTILESWMECGETLQETLTREECWAAQSIAYLRDLIPSE